MWTIFFVLTDWQYNNDTLITEEFTMIQSSGAFGYRRKLENILSSVSFGNIWGKKDAASII